MMSTVLGVRDLSAFMTDLCTVGLCFDSKDLCRARGIGFTLSPVNSGHYGSIFGQCDIRLAIASSLSMTISCILISHQFLYQGDRK